MGRRRNRWPSAELNNLTYNYWFDTLKLLAINRFEWKNLPDSVDPRFLELTLFGKGQCLFFYDEMAQVFLALPATISGKWNVYNIPIERRAFASNGYNYAATDMDSVIIWNNFLHTNLVTTTQMFAFRLYEIDRAIDVNIKQQKFPTLIKTSEEQRLVMENLMMNYDGNVPFIFGDKALDISGIESINTGAPYVADKLAQLRARYINDYLTRIGVENSNNEKKERMVSDEVGSNYGSIEAFRNLGLASRQQACEEINRMFGLDISVEYRSVLPTLVNGSMNPELGIDKQRELTEDEQDWEEDDNIE